jgi:hypothetical protein
MLDICRQHKDYLDGKLTVITHKALMTSAKCKFNWLWRGTDTDEHPHNRMTTYDHLLWECALLPFGRKSDITSAVANMRVAAFWLEIRCY